MNYDLRFHMSDVATVTAGNDSAAAADSRRLKERFPINTPLRIVPLDYDRSELTSEAFAAIGKDISTTGVAVCHAQAVCHSRAVITVLRGTGQFCVEAEVAWTKLASTGLYETGFKLIQ